MDAVWGEVGYRALREAGNLTIGAWVLVIFAATFGLYQETAGFTISPPFHYTLMDPMVLTFTVMVDARFTGFAGGDA